MSDSIYKAPESNVNVQTQTNVPDEILKRIRGGWIAAIISGVMTLILAIVMLNSGQLEELFSAWAFFDVIFIFILAFGIYKKSRTAATIMFGYFLLSKILIFIETQRLNGIFLAVIFLYFYFQAMMATYEYHRLINEPQKAEPEAQNAPTE